MKKLKNLIALILCGIAFFLIAAGSGTEVTTSTDSGGTTGQTGEIAKYGLNQDIYITRSTGKYRVKFNKVYETKRRNQYADVPAKKVVIIEYEYENLDINEDVSVSDYDFKLYDKENNKLETYPDTNTKYGDSVGKGRKTTAVAAYALNSDSNYIELEYYDNIWNNKADCRVILEW